MPSTKFSNENVPVVYIQLDEKEFVRIRVVHSVTVARLRVILSENHKLLPSTHFYDSKNYLIRKDEEEVITIKVLLHTNDIIKMKNDETSSTQKLSNYISDSEQLYEKIAIKCSRYIVNELLSIIKWLWIFPVKPIIMVILMCFISYYSYTKLFCSYAHHLPFVTMYCPAESLDSIPLPPLSQLAENSASLANALTNADVSAPMRFVQVKISLIAVKSQVKHSDIDTIVKEELITQILELQQLAESGAEHLNIMLAAFGGAIDRLRIYTQSALDGLTKVIEAQAYNKKQLQIGNVKNESGIV
jgi:hypothetical protein